MDSLANPSKNQGLQIVSVKLVRESAIPCKAQIPVKTPAKAYDLIKEFIADADREHFLVVCLDMKNKPTSVNVVSIGALNSTLVHPREVFKVAILSNAAGILLAHNHPSGDPTPSIEDIELTKRLFDGGKILGIDVIDHIIIGDQCYKSLKNEQLI